MGLRTNKQINLKSQTWEEEEGEEEERDSEKGEDTAPQSVPVGKRGPPRVALSKERGKRQCTRPLTSHHHLTVSLSHIQVYPAQVQIFYEAADKL